MVHGWGGFAAGVADPGRPRSLRLEHEGPRRPVPDVLVRLMPGADRKLLARRTVRAQPPAPCPRLRWSYLVPGPLGGHAETTAGAADSLLTHPSLRSCADRE